MYRLRTIVSKILTTGSMTNVKQQNIQLIATNKFTIDFSSLSMASYCLENRHASNPKIPLRQLGEHQPRGESVVR
jgi:hypothetical protein